MLVFQFPILGNEDVKDKENYLILNIYYIWGTVLSCLEFSSFKPIQSSDPALSSQNQLLNLVRLHL